MPSGVAAEPSVFSGLTSVLAHTFVGLRCLGSARSTAQAQSRFDLSCALVFFGDLK